MPIQYIRPLPLYLLSALALLAVTIPAQASIEEPSGIASTLETAEKSGDASSAWKLHGGFSQFYRRNVSYSDAAGTTVNQSELDTDFDAGAQLQRPDYQLQSRITGTYRDDYRNDTDNDPYNITSLYFDAADADRQTLGRIGRQAQNRGGVFGSFDGISLSRQIAPKLRLNLVGGHPLDPGALNHVATDTSVYGLNADFGTFAEAWNFNAFAVEQNTEGRLDRRAVGGEMHYTRERRSALALLDYDVSYRSCNLVFLAGNWLFRDDTALNLVYDQRKNPFLSTRNALLGQSETSLSALGQRFSEEQIRALAMDRSADSRRYTVSLAHPLGPKLQIGGDINLYTLSATPASGGVVATPASGEDWSYSMHITGSDLIKTGDIANIGLQRNIDLWSDTISLNLNTRYPVDRSWHINPLVHFDRRRYLSDDSTEWTAAPALRVSYMWRRDLNLELETGGAWSSHNTGGTTENITDYYVSMGYRVDF